VKKKQTIEGEGDFPSGQLNYLGKSGKNWEGGKTVFKNNKEERIQGGEGFFSG